jgi:hypothetical protein
MHISCRPLVSPCDRPAPRLVALIAVVGAAALAAPAGAHAQADLSTEHQAIAFLVGHWETTSEFADGRVALGDLRYQWVLGGGWMRITFTGEAPDGGVWETHAMQRWNPEAEGYESFVFRDGGPPVHYTGSAPGPGRYRIQGTSDAGVTIGIDYRATDDGGVYQENWALVDGERRVTLRTTYRPRGGETGAFVVRLGTDTTAVEEYTRTEDRLEARTLSRTPQARLFEAVVEFREDGAIARYETRVIDPAAPAGEGLLQSTVTRYEDDGAEIETTGPGGARTTRVEADPSMVPFSFNHFSLMELAVQRALARGEESIHLLSGGPMPVEVRRVASDEVAVETGQLGRWVARVDDEGRILEMTAGALGRDVERVSDLDLEGLARRFVDEDARGVGMGPLSPRDTLRTMVAGADFLVDYSRPSARGRPVFGGIIPWGEVWRTGADVATHLTTSRDLRLGDQALPAGTYTIFTIPEPDRWTLIINRQTGQPGTEHDPEQDVVRVPLEVTRLHDPVERFTISVEEEGDGGVVRFLWERTEARVPFRVEGGGGPQVIRRPIR